MCVWKRPRASTGGGGVTYQLPFAQYSYRESYYTFIPLPLFYPVDVVKIGADACLCVPMRADAVDAVISHTPVAELFSDQ